jgi:hypothetical protein
VAFSEPLPPFQPFNPYGGQGMMGMFMQMMSSQMAGQHGMMPMGFNGGNPATTLRQLKLTEDQQQAIYQGGRQDMPMIMDTIRGTMQASGQAWTPEAQQSARQMAETGINLAAMGSPEMLDKISGGRSATAMAGYMFSGGRHSSDPVYGDIGLSANSTGAMVRDVHNRFYGDRQDRDGNTIAGSGAREWRSRTNGVSAGEMGQLYSRLSQEGMMSQVKPMSRREQEEFDDASPDEQDDMKASRRKRAAKKTAKKLEEWTGTVAALKDVFGAGSSFDDLMTAMEGMTGGTTSQMTGQEVERSIRNLSNSGELAGVAPGQVAQRVSAMAPALEGMGINGIFAQQFVGEGLNFSTGYRTSGAGSVSAWGLYGADRQRQEHTQNIVGASQSKLANRMGAVARLGDRLGKDMFTTPEGKKLYKALQRGEIPEQYADMSQGEFITFMTENSELSEQEVQYALKAKNANQEAVYSHGLADATQKHQKAEMRDRFMTPALGQSASVSLGGAGVADPKGELSGTLGETMAGSISGMGANTLADTEARNAAIAKDVEKKLEAEAAKDPNGPAAKYLAKIGPKGSKERQRALVLMAEQGYSAMEQQLQSSGVLKPGESYVNFGVRNADEVRAGSDQAEAVAEVRSTGESAAAGQGPADGPVQRVAERVQEGIGGGVGEIVGAMAGVATDEQTSDMIGGQLQANKKALKKARAGGNTAKVKALEQEQATLMGLADMAGMTNESGEFDPSGGRGEGSEVEFDPNINFSGATVILNGAEVMTEAGGGIERSADGGARGGG